MRTPRSERLTVAPRLPIDTDVPVLLTLSRTPGSSFTERRNRHPMARGYHVGGWLHLLASSRLPDRNPKVLAPAPRGRGTMALEVGLNMKMLGAAMMVFLVASGAMAGNGAVATAPTGAPTATTPARRMLDVRQLMTQQAFQATGLVKLSPTELDALNRWITDLAVKIYAYKEPRSGCEDAIETTIDGDFQGWTGDTTFTLMNGQIWRQTGMGYTYSYALSPEVVIYKTELGCKMRVDGAQGSIIVERLK